MMTDNEILATVYRWMSKSIDRCEDADFSKRRLKECKEFVDQEWQKQDEHKEWQDELFAKNDDGQMYNAQAESLKQFHETHVGLEMSEDGTVTKVG